MSSVKNINMTKYYVLKQTITTITSLIFVSFSYGFV